MPLSKILLTDEEINKACKERDRGHPFPRGSEGYRAVTLVIAKAQVKKVVEECGDVDYLINDHGEWGHCRAGWEDSNATHVAIPYKVYQSLLDEVKE